MTDFVAQARREHAARLKATPTGEQAAGVMVWLRARLEELAQQCAGSDWGVEVDGLLRILDLHEPAEMTSWNQRVHVFRAYCVGESWTCYGDGEEFVQAPCLHVRLIARRFAGVDGFPRLLAVTEEELTRKPA